MYLPIRFYNNKLVLGYVAKSQGKHNDLENKKGELPVFYWMSCR